MENTNMMKQRKQERDARRLQRARTAQRPSDAFGFYCTEHGGADHGADEATLKAQFQALEPKEKSRWTSMASVAFAQYLVQKMEAEEEEADSDSDGDDGDGDGDGDGGG